MSHLRTKALRNRVNELLSEYEISEIMNALWANVDAMRLGMIDDPESYTSQEKNEEMLKDKSDSAKLFRVWSEFNSHC